MDGVGNAYVTGFTTSSSFPTVNALYRTLRGRKDAFVIKFDVDGRGPLYSTYLGGAADDVGRAIAVDAEGRAYVTGWTASTDFPTMNARYPSLRGYTDAFVIKLDAGGRGPIYSTYLGGSNTTANPGETYAQEGGYGIAVDRDGNTYVTGTARSADFPTISAPHPDFSSGVYDAFLTKLDFSGGGPVYSTYLGGSGWDNGTGLALDEVGNAYVVGATTSNDFPTISALYPDHRGGWKAFITKIASEESSGVPRLAIAVLSQPAAANSGFNISVHAVNGAGLTQSDFQGQVTLRSSLGRISPSAVQLHDGAWTGLVSIDTAACALTITASDGTLNGVSVPVAVPAGNATASLRGSVADTDGAVLAGAIVTVDIGGVQSRIEADSKGHYSVSSLCPGSYRVWASYDGRDGESKPVNIARPGQQLDLTVPSAGCNDKGLTPILLVPGIGGSSTGDGGLYPSLKERDSLTWDSAAWSRNSKSRGLHDPGGIAGWRHLVETLDSQGYKKGCNLFPVPYDWTKPVTRVAEDYLRPAIEHAISVSGKSQVTIVAHSMGGLVARAYIVSSPDHAAKVARLAMVGTPNAGASKAYYLWEGGDLDKADGYAWSELGFWKNTTENLAVDIGYPERLYTTLVFGGGSHRVWDKGKVRSFLHSEVPSGKDLLPTYSFLNKNGSSELLSEIRNDTLLELNGRSFPDSV